MNKIIKLILLATLFAQPSFAHEGGMDGGGGSYVMIDGKLMIADPYYAETPLKDVHQIKPVTFEQLPRELQAFTKQVLNYLERQRVGVRYLTDDIFALNNLANQVLQGKYYLVPKEREQNVPCDRYLPMLNRPVEEHFQFGCTFEDQTFIFIDKFNLAPVEQQAFALLHERLWATKPEADQKDIAEFVSNTMFFYDRFASQILENNRDPLTPAEIARLRKFYAQAQAFTGDAGPIPAVSQFTSGGAVLMGKRPKTKLDGSFLGLATYIEGNEVNPNINITNSVVVGSWLRGNGAIRSSRIIKSGVRDYQLDHVELTNSGVYGVQGYNLDFWNSLGGFMGQNKIAAVKTPTLANGSTRNSWIVAQAAILATGSKPFQIEDSFLNTRLGIWAGEGLKLKNVEMTGSWDFYRSADKAAQEEPGARLLAVNFGKNVTMENLTVGLDYFWDHPLTTDTGPYAITVLPNTEIRNGKILITKFLKGSVPGPNAPPDVYSHSFRPSFSLVIGQEGRAFRKDLGGKKAEARNEGGGLFQAIEKYFP